MSIAVHPLSLSSCLIRYAMQRHCEVSYALRVLPTPSPSYLLLCDTPRGDYP
jgi:hypothetical protein